jgi:D-alanine transaminase
MNKTMVWLNGDFIEYQDAKVSVEDRGFQFSDGVYEVLRAVNGRYFAFEEHMTRLRRSLESVEIEISLKDNDFLRIGEKLLQESGCVDFVLYIQVTRGAAPRQHGFPRDPAIPTVVVMGRPHKSLPGGCSTEGVETITLKDERWLRCDIKSIGLLANVLARNRASRANAFEAILIRENAVSEGSSSNVFLVKDGTLCTPKADYRILRGVTRDYVLKLAGEEGIAADERDISLIELRGAEEVFLTSTTLEVMPVVKIDQSPVAGGKVGNVTRRLMKRYHRLLLGES